MTADFIIATGGTGGHIFPALSLCKHLKSKGYSCFVLADKRFLNFQEKIPKDLQYKIISTAPLNGNILKILISLVKIFIGVISAALIIRKKKPKMIISFGGYPSFPTMLAALILRKPLMIHEQNSVVGRANKPFIRWADIISVPFYNIKGLEHIAQSKIHVSGNPVDKSISKIGESDYPNISKDGKINLLILGGSQGAKILSKVIPSAIKKLKPSLRSRLHIVQQCRKEDIAGVENAYKSLAVECTISSFFLDINKKLEEAHLVIARSGASTVSELIAAGRPAILVPIAISNENHQFLNAKVLSDNSAAWILEEREFNDESLSKKLTYLLSNPSSLKEASANARSLFTDSNKNMLELIEKFCPNVS